MAPTIQVSREVLKGLDQLEIPYDLIEEPKPETPQEDFIQLPSGIYVSRQRSHLGKNWYESNALEGLDSNEFRELLIYAREHEPELYDEITAVRSSWRAEWIGVQFKKKRNGLHMATHKGEEKLAKNTLMEDRTPGISLDAWLSKDGKYTTSQGLPTEDILSGDLWYWFPRDGRVARFDADSVRAVLYCDRGPSGRGSDLGVRAVKRE